MSRQGYYRLVLGLFIASCLAAGPAPAQSEPEVLFDVKTDKKVKDIYLIGENEDHILLTNKAKIFVHDSTTGEQIWSTKVANYAADGLDLIWNDKNFIVSTKSGMINFEIASGKVAWETSTKLAMKNFNNYFNFKNGFILHIGNKFTGFNIKTGEVLWETTKLDLNGKLAEAGISNIYSYTGDFGDRLVVLGNSATQVINMDTGNILSKVKSKFTDKNENPVGMLGSHGVILFYKDGTAALSLGSGEVLWEIDEEVHPKRGYKLFERDGKTYGLFTFKKKTMFFDMDLGSLLWETGPDKSGMMAYSELLDDGTLVNVALQKFMMPKEFQKNNGSTAVAWGFDYESGDLKWGPSYLFYSMAAGPIRNQFYVGMSNPEIHPKGWLFYGYGQSTKMPGDDPLKSWKKNEKGYEGPVLLDPNTGEVLYRANLTMYDTWLKSLSQAGAATEWWPGLMMINDTAPAPVYADGSMLVAANQSVVKLDLTTGETLWEGPDYGGLVTNLSVADGKVFGTIGYNSWTFGARIKKWAGKTNDDIIRKTKRSGFFLLDESTGEQAWVIDKAKLPPDLHLLHYAAGAKVLYLSDGKVLRGVDVAGAKTAFEIDMKKGLTGEVSAAKGVIWVESEISTHYSYFGTGGWSMTTVTTFENTMEHGFTALPDDSLLVLATDGPARVLPDGSVKWKSEWDWKIGAINFKPAVTNDGLIYQYKKKLTYFSLDDGSVRWQSKEKKDAEYIITRKKDKIFVIEDKAIACYKI